MKHPNDDKTIDLVGPVNRQRGRPATGTAMTGAERQALRRQRLREQGVVPVTVEVTCEAAAKLRKFVEFKDLTLGEVIDRLIMQQLARKR